MLGRRFGARPRVRLGLGLPAARARSNRWVRSGLRPELQGARQGVEHLLGRSTEAAALELGVVLDAHAGQPRDFAAAQPGHTPLVSVHRRPACSGDSRALRLVRKSRISARVSTSRR